VWPIVPGATAITVGSFDGVHIGHAALLEAAREHAGAGGRVVALAFFPHPLTVLRPEAAPPRISAWAPRERWLREAGADAVVRLDPTPDLLSLTPEAFARRVTDEWSPTAWVEGPDFRFGRGRSGDATLLASLGDRLGFRAVIVEPALATLTDLTVAPASSTLARWLIGRGRVRDAAAVLGRPFELTGVVTPGERRGRQIGCATANIAPDAMPPADGVYAGRASLPDGRRLPAAISVGTKPTFGDRPRTVEAHLMRDDGSPWDGRDAAGADLGYGWPVALTFTDWLREQIRYDRVGDLSAQIERDLAHTLELAGRGAGAPA